MRKSIEKPQLLSHLKAMGKFNAWAENHRLALNPQEALASIGTLYDLIPAEFRHRAVQTEGILLMRQAFYHLKGVP